jgi:AhpC/TSA family protein/cytochrome c biogenesis DsbD-like protein
VQLVELQGRFQDLRKAGMGLAAISYDPVPILADFAARRGITFPLLSDAGSETIKRYGILNTNANPSNQLYGFPFPGTYFVDRRGVVTSRVFEPAYQERSTISSLLVRQGRPIDAPATKVAGAYLDLISYATDRVATLGTHFSLVLDVRPAPRVHVYAPGVSGYKPVRLALNPQPGVVVRMAQFPKPEDYFFKPLNEHVPVYQRPFRIVQDVMLDPSKDGSAALEGVTMLTITGTFDYQACDDKVCFAPQSLPLSWTIGVKPLDGERSKPQEQER